jgi:hypothetical protein
MRAPVSTAVAIGVGLIVLVSLFIPELGGIRTRILTWTILLAGLALLLGLVNLFQVHWRKIREKKEPINSLTLLVAMVTTFAITLWQGSSGAVPNWIFFNIQVPVETSLMALLAISLTIAAARMMQRRIETMTFIFLLTLFILLLGAAPLFGIELPLFTRIISPYVSNSLSVAATRGLLIGVGLGTLTTGLRIFLGADKPYDG